MTKILAFAIAIAGIAAVSAPIQARLAANGTSLNGTSLNGTSLNGITTGTALNGQIIGIELPAGTGEAE
jgi:hypothetical protein